MKTKIDCVTVYSEKISRDPIIVIRYKSGAAKVITGYQNLPETVFKFTQTAKINVSHSEAGSEIVFR